MHFRQKVKGLVFIGPFCIHIYDVDSAEDFICFIRKASG